ncbi:MAG TPA: hypothetical protein DIW54_06025 [Chitinophagaceae bacterium]|nr:hypothetical protein [Chitinophagaceae bacterium]HCT22901.1 hypothetical protein [Chitinophagaceae bacterium]
MNQLIQRYRWYLLGAILGSISGYIYYAQIGCVNGTCAITSNPWRSTVYFAVLGLLLTNIILDYTKKSISKDDATI